MESMIRELYFSDEFWAFYHKQQDKVKCKFDYVISIIRKEKVICMRCAFRWVQTNTERCYLR